MEPNLPKIEKLVHELLTELGEDPARERRADDEHRMEFVASTDNWFRPTMIRTGPDGAMYVCDWRTDSGGAGKLARNHSSTVRASMRARPMRSPTTPNSSAPRATVTTNRPGTPTRNDGMPMNASARRLSIGRSLLGCRLREIIVHPMTTVVSVTDDSRGGYAVATLPTDDRGRKKGRTYTARRVVLAAETRGEGARTGAAVAADALPATSLPIRGGRRG